jgi:hypothetical protein
VKGGCPHHSSRGPVRRVGLAGFAVEKAPSVSRVDLLWSSPRRHQSSRIWARWTRSKVPRAGECSQLFAGMRDTQGPRLRNGVDAGSACVSAFAGPLRNDERYRVLEDCSSFQHIRSRQQCQTGRRLGRKRERLQSLGHRRQRGRRKVVSAPLAEKRGGYGSQPGVDSRFARHMDCDFVLIGQYE